MADPDNKSLMIERHRLVVALIDVNSQQLRCDSQSAGLDIERLNAQRDIERTNSAADACRTLAEIEKRAAEVEAKKRKLAQERDWLETSLTEFDAQLQLSPTKPTSANN